MNWDDFKCTRCNLLLSVGPIKYSNGFHCGRCSSDGPIVKVYENLARMHKFPCRYQKNGCTEESTFNLIGLHENSCEYKKILCIFPSCKQIFIELDIQEHYEKCHPENFASSNIIEVWQSEKEVIKLYHTFQITCLIVISLSSSDLEVIVTYFGRHLRRDYEKYNLIIYKYDMEQFWTLGSRQVERYNRLCLNNKHYQVNLEAIQYFCGKNCPFWLEIQFPDAQHFNNTKLSSDLLQIMECPVCYEILDEITQCETGHSICKGCAKSLKKCPSCNCGFLNITNYLAENLAQTIQQYCKNQNKGCSFYGKLQEKVQHEKSCLDCPFSEENSCNFFGNVSKLTEHCLNDHSCYTKCLSNDRFSLNDASSSNNKKRIYFQEKIFIFERLIKNNKVYFQTSMLGNQENNGLRYKFVITLQNRSSAYNFSDKVLQSTNEFMIKDSLALPEDFLKEFQEEGLVTYDFRIEPFGN